MPAASAQQIPPRAFQTRNVRQRIRSAPASQAAVTRAPATKRARNTAFDPWRSKKRSPSARNRRRQRRKGPLCSSSRRPQPDESREREVPEVRRQLKEGH